MGRIPYYSNFDNAMFDKQWEDDAEDSDDCNKVTRCGLDDPIAMSQVDYRTRIDLLHVMMIAYSIQPEDLIDFLHLLYPRANETKAKVNKKEVVARLKKIREKYHGYK